MPAASLHQFVQKHAPDIFASVRPLNAPERQELIDNGNTAESWDMIGVADGFTAANIRGSHFFGCVILGTTAGISTHRELSAFPRGIYNSTIGNSIIKNDVTISSVLYCNFYSIESGVILHNIGELTVSPNARFGQGGLCDASHEWISLINENGGRAVIPFTGMTSCDAYIWAKYRSDKFFQNRLIAITDTTCAPLMNRIGQIGCNAVVRNVKSISDSSIGCFATVNGAECIHNTTVRSTKEEPSEIGAAVQLKNTITGYKNHIASGTQLLSVVTGSCVSIHQNARISHSFIGDNSEIGCCEIAHSLIFPSHGQHHNNSFLIASMIGGQSNIAAGATIGSNHNSRTNDGELWASRGFWPGLCASFKHNSRFASYVLCAKASYPSELDIPFPFSLVLNDSSRDTLVVFPAYYFTHNMYSFIRSKVKFVKRDKRIVKEQSIEHNPLAPDTIEEIFSALAIIEEETAKQWYHARHSGIPAPELCRSKGRELLKSGTPLPDLDLKGHIERSNRSALLRNTSIAWNMYNAVIRWYAVSEIVNYVTEHNTDLCTLHIPQRVTHWTNCGGQIAGSNDLELLFEKIKTDKSVKTWKDIHAQFDALSKRYEQDKFYHALGALAALDGIDESSFTKSQLAESLRSAIAVCRDIPELARVSRQKDYTDHYRAMVYDTKEEMNIVLGNFDDDSVIADTTKSMQGLIDGIERICRTLV